MKNNNPINITDLGDTIRLDYGNGLITDLTKVEIDDICEIPIANFVGVDNFGKLDGFDCTGESYVNISRDLKAHERDIQIYPANVDNFVIADVASLYALLSGMFKSHGSKYRIFNVGLIGQDGITFDYLPFFPYNANILVFVNGALQIAGYANDLSGKVIFDSELPLYTDVLIVSL